MDTVRRKIKFDYYRVVFRNPDDQIDRYFDLRRWIHEALKYSLEGRTFDYRQERVRLENAGYDEDLKYWYLHFVRMRDHMLPSKAKLTTNVEPFELDDDEYLGEEVTALYDEDHHILMLQRNRHSLSPSGLEEYLNLIWERHENNQKIYLRPILACDNVSRAKKKGNVYRRLLIRFADLDKREVSNTKSPIRRFISAIKEYGAVNAEITLTLGYSRDKSLSPETVIDTISDLTDTNDLRGLVSKAEVAIKEDDTAVEIIDLFEDRAQSYTFFDVPRRTTLSHYAIFEEMVKIYEDNKVRILGYLNGLSR